MASILDIINRARILQTQSIGHWICSEDLPGCDLVEGYQSLGGTCCQPEYGISKFLQMSVTIYHTKSRHIPEDSNCQSPSTEPRISHGSILSFSVKILQQWTVSEILVMFIGMNHRQVTLLVFLREMLGSNLGRDTDYLDWTEVLPDKCRLNASIAPRPRTSIFF
jgi:hypothetical protein